MRLKKFEGFSIGPNGLESGSNDDIYLKLCRTVDLPNSFDMGEDEFGEYVITAYKLGSDKQLTCDLLDEYPELASLDFNSIDSGMAGYYGNGIDIRELKKDLEGIGFIVIVERPSSSGNLF